MKHLRIMRYVDEVARTGSIRKAAGHLNVTASAVNRRIMDLEEELGAPLFERRPRGVRLTAAGEVFVHYLREQDSGVERMKSQIEELKGFRRGTVRIACSQALALDFLPREIAGFRTRHPLVSFEVKVLDHERAMTALAAYEVDLVLVFRPPFLPNFQPLMTLEQRIVAVMSADHPLAAQPTIRLRDCANYPVALPEGSLGGRQLLDQVSARSGLTFKVAAESNSSELEQCPRTTGSAWWHATSTTATSHAQTWFSASCAPATCRSQPQYLPKSSCACSRPCAANRANRWLEITFRVRSFIASKHVGRKPVTSLPDAGQFPSLSTSFRVWPLMAAAAVEFGERVLIAAP